MLTLFLPYSITPVSTFLFRRLRSCDDVSFGGSCGAFELNANGLQLPDFDKHNLTTATSQCSYTGLITRYLLFNFVDLVNLTAVHPFDQ